MIPGSPLSPGISRFSSSVSASSARRRVRSSTRRWRRLPNSGTITSFCRSRTKRFSTGEAAALAEAHPALGVREPGHAAQHDGRVELLAQREGAHRVVARLLAVRRLEHRHFGEAGVVAVVLLVLAGELLGVVGGDEDQPAAHPGVGEGEQRVGGDVDADVLHGDQHPGAGPRCAGADLEGDFLVHRPLAARAGQRREHLEDLGARRAGVPGGEIDPRFPGPAGDRLVAGEQRAGRHDAAGPGSARTRSRSLAVAAHEPSGCSASNSW